MKRLLSLLLIVTMLLSLAACGETAAEPQTPDTTDNPETVVLDTAEPAVSAEDILSDAFVDPQTGWGAYDELLEQINTTADPSARAQKMHEAEDMLMASWCVLPLYTDGKSYLVKSSVNGIYTDHSGAWHFSSATLPETAESLRVVFALDSEPDSLDPIYSSTVEDNTFTVNLFTGLFTVNEDGDAVPALADTISTEDGLTYTVTLKSGLRWSSGWESISANDFVYSWRRMAASENSEISGLFSNFAGFGTEEGITVSAEDSLTLIFTLNEPCPYIETLLSLPAFAPVKQSEVQKYNWYGDQKEPGAWAAEAGFLTSGPYVVSAWEEGKSITLEKNTYWYDAENVTIEKITITFAEDEEAAFSLFKNGRADITSCIPASEYQAVASEPTLHTAVGLGTCYAAFNVTGSLFDGKSAAESAAIRQALSLLIDRDYLCTLDGNSGCIPAATYIPSGMADGNGSEFHAVDDEGYFDPYALNDNSSDTLAQARALLKAAGFEFENGKLSDATPIQITCVTDESYAAVAADLQQDFTMLGIEMTVESRTKDSASAKMGKADLMVGDASAAVNDPQTMLALWTTENTAGTVHFGG